MTPVQFLSRQPLRRQVVTAVTILIVVPLVAVSGWSATRVLAERQADLRDEASSVASTAESALDQYLATIDSLGAVLVEHPAVQSLDAIAADRLFKAALALQPLILNIGIVDRQGVLHATALPGGARHEETRAYAKAVFETGRPAISGFTFGTITHRPTVVMAYPVRNGAGGIVGALGIALNLTELGKVFGSISLPAGSVITLTDSDSRVLARTLDADRYVGTILQAPGGSVPPARVPRTQILTGMDGVRRVFGNTIIDRGPWLLSVGIPASVALARAIPLWQRNAMIAVVFALMSFAISFLIALTVTGPLAKLTDAARRIAQGDLSPPPPVPALSLEVAELHRGFDTMAANLREARARLGQQVEEERRMREVLESLQRQVVRQERLAAVGVLVSGVAHELNNPLQAILGGAELLERREGLSADEKAEVEFIKTQSERARDIIRNLSRFSSQHSGPPEPVDLREVIAEVVQLRKRDLGRAAIAFDVEIASSRRVNANFTELEQVLLNFVINAQHAIEAAGRSSGRVMIRLVDDGRRVRVEVKDDGPGVAKADEAKLFQPFFTTKPVGKGTGLGLSVSYGIVESYGGTIGHRANDWGGATFFFELPVAGSTKSQGDDRTPLLHRSVLPGV